MIVLDANVVVDLLLEGPGAAGAARAIEEHGAEAWAPHLVDAEVGQVVRRFALSGLIPPERAGRAMRDLAAMPMLRVDHRPILASAFDMRERLTFYDALYLALAARLDAPLLTGDGAVAEVAEFFGVDVVRLAR
ncbi:MAG: type II toxin-antitoxin system VapC family toxin [Actinobacteria bacterium]|nr:type II toxin-antitoxin system VapC family toxin [Actinomycetota bacterium]